MHVPSVGGEDPLKEDVATHSSALAGTIPWAEDLAGYSPYAHTELDTTKVTQHASTI